MRAHLYKPITEVHGNIQFGTVVRILQPDAAPDSVAPITDPVFKYKSEIDYTELGTTFTVTNGVVDAWLDNPQYVMLGLTPPNQVEYFIDNVAVLAPGTSVSGGGGSPLWVARMQRDPDAVSVNNFAGWCRAADGSDAVPTSVYGDVGVLGVNIDNGADNSDAFTVVVAGLYSLMMFAGVEYAANPGEGTLHINRNDFFDGYGGRLTPIVNSSFQIGGQIDSGLMALGAGSTVIAGVDAPNLPAINNGKIVGYLTRWA